MTDSTASLIYLVVHTFCCEMMSSCAVFEKYFSAKIAIKAKCITAKTLKDEYHHPLNVQKCINILKIDSCVFFSPVCCFLLPKTFIQMTKTCSCVGSVKNSSTLCLLS